MPVIDQQRMADSVIAVPPLARHENLCINLEANEKIIRYLESGGVKTLIYGGNANFYHIGLSEYAGLLEMLEVLAEVDTWVIPSAGPAFGMMMDQAEIVREFDFPTVMILPHRELTTPSGIATAVRAFVESAGCPIVLYVKYDGWIDVATVKRMVDDGLISWIKYAIVRDDPSQDDFLRDLVSHVDPRIIVSGIGEQPAIVHLRDFGLASFTSGCVCVAPAMSMRMLADLHKEDYEQAAMIRQQFEPLEELRNEIHPIRVLHAAVDLAEIATTGSLLPLLSEVNAEDRRRIKHAAMVLREQEQSSFV